MKSTLQKYILDKNRMGVVGEIFDRFSSSMAGYSLVCYILALGDRHKNNIMIRDDGALLCYRLTLTYASQARCSTLTLGTFLAKTRS